MSSIEILYAVSLVLILAGVFLFLHRFWRYEVRSSNSVGSYLGAPEMLCWYVGTAVFVGTVVASIVA